MEIYKNNYFSFIIDGNTLFINVFSSGFDMREMNSLTLDMPHLQLNNFMGLKSALQEAANQPISIGIIKPKYEVIVSKDEMEANLKLNFSAAEFERNRIAILAGISPALADKGVTDGIITSVINSPIPVQKEILIAKGIRPIDGENAVIRYFKLTDKRPSIQIDGTVNHYELQLIDNVKKGDWLGEKIHATNGTPGKTVTGKLLPARTGRDYQVRYDRKTVGEFEEDGKIVLRALIDGAVKFEDDKIKVQDHLIIEGDVGFDTGNIDFKGYVTIKGTVKDGFSVSAKNDISVLGEMGIGAVEKIVSHEGSVYIKGGAFGKNIARIDAAKNVYIKYCNECTIIAGENIHVGFYALDSILQSKNIYTDPDNGKIIGGSIKAEVQVIAGVIGNQFEKKTTINVHGFDRLKIKRQLDGILDQYRNLVHNANKIKRQIEVYENGLSGAEYVNMKEYRNFIDKYQDVLEQLNHLNEERENLEKILETKGEGEVAIFKAAYPHTFLKIKEMEKRIGSIISGNFYVSNGEFYES